MLFELYTFDLRQLLSTNSWKAKSKVKSSGCAVFDIPEKSWFLCQFLSATLV